MPSPKDDRSKSPRRAKSPRSPRKSPRSSSPRKQELDDGPRPQRAFKYAYSARHETWTRTECSVLIAKKAFQEGGMRLCYKMYEIGLDGEYAPGVAKIFKPDVGDDEEEVTRSYFDEAMTQTVADSFARQFNFCLPEKQKHLHCRFLPVHVLHLIDQGSILCNMEPYLQGQYIKHNDNDGHVETDLELPQAFSHFTWECSNRTILVCDIQGVGNFYTDPQIHSQEGEGFGMGNIGQDGIDRFLETHKCNSICRMLGLGQPCKKKGKWVSDRKTSFFARAKGDSGPAWNSFVYKGAMQEGLTKLRNSMRKGGGSSGMSEADELTRQQQKLLQEKLMLLVKQKGSLENQMLLSPKRAPLAEKKTVPGKDRSDLASGRLTSSFEWDGVEDKKIGDHFTCKYCGVVGDEASVSRPGTNHDRVCPRYNVAPPERKPVPPLFSDTRSHEAPPARKAAVREDDNWLSAEVKKLQQLLEAQTRRIRGLDMGEVQQKSYAYERP